MTDDGKREHFTVPALEAEPGEGELSRLELSYLHAAGIDPHLLNAMDRADVIRLLVMHPERIENPRIGDVAALLYRSGLLEEMLEGDTDDDDDDGDDDDKQEKKKGQKRRERVDQMFCDEVKHMQAMEPGGYAREYPLPAGLLTVIPAEGDPQPERVVWRTHLDFPKVATPVSDLASAVAAINPLKLGIALDEDASASPDKPDKTPEVERPSSKNETESSSSAQIAPEGWVAAVTETDPDSDSLKK